jgi:hypothetical protein
MGEYKYQHYVPQTYLNSWLDDNNQLYLYDSKTNCLIKACKPSNILGEKNLYTKTVNELLACTDEDIKNIFECLKDYNIYINNEKLENEQEYARQYFDFDNWIIKGKDGRLVSKKKLKNTIEQIRILTIEKNWKMYEDGWNELLKALQEGIDKGNLTIKEIKGLKDFIICQQWRTKDNIDNYKQIIDLILCVLKDDLKDDYEKILDEYARCYFLKKLDEFQNGNKENHILKVRKALDKLHIVFYKSTGNESFITSDKPVFIIDDNDSFMKGKMNGLYFPITPKLLCAMYRGEANKYTVTDMPENTVRLINNLIKTKSKEFYISNRII